MPSFSDHESSNNSIDNNTYVLIAKAFCNGVKHEEEEVLLGDVGLIKGLRESICLK